MGLRAARDELAALHLRTSPSGLLCQLRPAADITPKMLTAAQCQEPTYAGAANLEPHSIISSERASSVGGTSRPSVVGCSTGRSAGLPQHKILSTYSAHRIRFGCIIYLETVDLRHLVPNSPWMREAPHNGFSFHPPNKFAQLPAEIRSDRIFENHKFSTNSIVLRPSLADHLVSSGRVWRVPAETKRGAHLYGAADALGREIELALCQPSNVVGHATFRRHQLVRRLDRRR